MNRFTLMFVTVIVPFTIVYAEDPLPVTHWDFQSVHEDGSSSFDDFGPFQVVLEGILLNNPEQWLDPAPDSTPGPWQMGGQWEIFVQGEGDDHAGTFCWMGQNYGNGPGDENYSNEEWIAELCRLNHDPATGYVFRAGDRIRITGTYLFYAGKLNINENHETGDIFDFKIELIKPAVGLPQPEEIQISDLKNPDNTEIFDPNRLTGAEFYQSRLVRIEDVSVINPESWGPEKTVTIQDTNGLIFPVKLGIGSGISKFPCPTGQIDVIGIMDQAGPGYPPDPTKGYRLLVPDYNGNTRGNLPGDINNDFFVNLKDFAELAADWLQNRAGLHGCMQ